jgi:hypothetical protein
MHIRPRGRLSAATTRRLLDGGEGPSPLPQLLAAASAPATAAELRGEAAALAAFRSAPHAAPLPHDEPRRPPVRAASTFMIAKAVAAIALTASTAGGIALATTSTPADPPARPTREAVATNSAGPPSLVSAVPGPGAALVDPQPAADPSVAASNPSDGARTPVRPTPAPQVARPTGPCRASAGCADADPGAAARPSADPGTAARPTPPKGRPSAAPGNPDRRTGKPDTATDRAKDGTTDKDKPEKTGKPADDQETANGNGNGNGNADRGGSAGKGRDG